MTQEQKDKLENKSQEYASQFQGLHGVTKSNLKTFGIDFKAGAQTILDNPQEWGLVDSIKADTVLHVGLAQLEAENTRYRRALDEISNAETGGYEFEGLVDIAKEALKQQDNEKTDNAGN